MNESDIRKYAALMRELELTGLEITQDNQVVRLERTQTVAAPATAAEHPEPEEAGKPQNCVTITSPLVGIFYGAPAEDAEPYVTVGSQVTAGQTVCIIEAMKLMNELGADCDGEILEVLVSNGQMVEYGTELFRVRRKP